MRKGNAGKKGSKEMEQGKAGMQGNKGMKQGRSAVEVGEGGREVGQRGNEAMGQGKSRVGGGREGRQGEGVNVIPLPPPSPSLYLHGQVTNDKVEMAKLLNNFSPEFTVENTDASSKVIHLRADEARCLREPL